MAESASYFAPNDEPPTQLFEDMHLSRQVLKAINDMGYSEPTPIQACTIPVALVGRDVCGSAVTGSGKTAAFLIPILERIISRHSSGYLTATRALVLAPTRELANQIHTNFMQLSKYAGITSALVVGGLSLQAQEAELRKRPEVVIGTPGRVIDHIRNSMNFSLDDVEFLVLDEADRLLEMGFSAELNEVIKSCPKQRQTLLFSATMTESVESLMKLSLKNPVRLSVDLKFELVSTCAHEFVKVEVKGVGLKELDRLVNRRSKQSRNEQNKARMAAGDAAEVEDDGDTMPTTGISAGKQLIRAKEIALLALCSRAFDKKVIVFFRTKSFCHRVKVLMDRFGLRATEVHGNLSQMQRLTQLETFKRGEADILLTTNLAARGIDIEGIETVVNVDFPRSVTEYVHRVGRTARAGRTGRAITLVTDIEKPMLKLLIQRTQLKAKKRVIPEDAIETVTAKWEELQSAVLEDMEQEKVEKELRVAEMEANKAKNMLDHEAEIKARPARTWFATKHEKEVVSKMDETVDHKREHGFFEDLGDDGDDSVRVKKQQVIDQMDPIRIRREEQTEKRKANKGKKKDLEREELSKVLSHKVKSVSKTVHVMGRSGKAKYRHARAEGVRVAKNSRMFSKAKEKAKAKRGNKFGAKR